MKVIDDHQSDILVKKMALGNEIRAMFMKWVCLYFFSEVLFLLWKFCVKKQNFNFRLNNAFIIRAKQLFFQLREVCDAQQRTLRGKKFDMEQLLSDTDDDIDVLNNKLYKSSDLVLVSRKWYIVICYMYRYIC
jgi:hypothetical protein